MISLTSVAAAARFELQRGLTAPRMMMLAGLAAFPPGLCALLVWAIGADLSDFQSRGPALVFFCIIPGVTCLLGMLQWATPAIHSELEGRTWGYVAIRPGGAGSVLIGKYAAAVVWTLAAALIGLTLSLGIAQPRDITHVWLVFAGLSLCSTLAYGALFLFLGVLFLKRALFIAIGYTLLIEVIVSMAPATVNQLTIQYRLRALLQNWLAVEDLGPVLTTLFSDTSVWLHLTVLAVVTISLLAASLTVLQRRQLVSSAENRG